MNEAFIIFVASGLVQAGILIATIRFLSKRQDEDRKSARADSNGIGKITRSTMAELIILAKDQPDFPVVVRKLINGI